MKAETKLKKEILEEVDKLISYAEDARRWKEDNTRNAIALLFFSSLCFSMGMIIMIMFSAHSFAAAFFLIATLIIAYLGGKKLE